MDRHPDDPTSADDLQLVAAARTGDRLAFGVLYLRHHAAAWRIACVASRFSPDAELAVIEGFTRVFSALPADSEEFGSGPVSFRPYLLACVRQAALDRARAAGRSEAATPTVRRRAAKPENPPAPAALTGLTPEGEVVLASLEHHVARGALAALPEQSRTALWLCDVEAMTPGEIAAIVGGDPREVADLTARARADVRAGREAALGRHEVRSDCRFTVANLDTFAAGTLDPAKGVLVRSHLDICPPCRMRFGELANAPAALAAAVPAAPLLGGETQHHWLSSAGDVRPAQRLLPPGVAAAAPAHRLPDVLRRAGRAATRSRVPESESIDLTSSASPSPSSSSSSSSSAPGSPPGWTGAPGLTPSPTPSLPPAWTVPPARRPPAAPRRRDRRSRRLSLLAGGVPGSARRAGRAVWPALPATFLIVAWLGVMVSLPHLMSPSTAPGPDRLVLPAVQAYVPGYLPGAARPAGDTAAPSTDGGSTAPGLAAGAGAGFEAAAQDVGIPTGAPADGVRASAGPAAPPAARVRLIPTAVTPPSGADRSGSGPAAAIPPVAQAAAVTPSVVAAAPVVPISVAAAPAPRPSGSRADAPDRPGNPGREMKPRKPSNPRQQVKPGKELNQHERDRRPVRSVERPDRRDRPQPPRRDRIVTA